MKALITGGAGFVGSHLTDHLIAQGHEVTVLDDLSTGQLSNLSDALDGPNGARVSMVEGSITDAALVDEMVAQVDTVFHLAAAVGVFTIQTKTLDSMRVNLHGTETVLDAAHRHGARFLLTSTSEVYGKNTAIGLHEDADRIIGSPLKSRWSYAEAKALDEAFTHQYVVHLGLAAVMVRMFNTVGPRQSGRYGMVLPRLVKQALAGEPLTVYGTGNQSRCFGHVGDVVPALATLIETDAAIGQVFNIGNPEQVSINELAERIIAKTGSASPIVHLPYLEAYGPGYEDMERRVPDCSRLHDLIGFTPTHSLDDSIEAVIDDQFDQVGLSADQSIAG
ncbi:NAD(P)-dependent oxidoreductase [Allobranchiibius sp. CTAmp26]|uniref:NAD-dependent epimerase/dehydratase family protein n=1 Tax=Allobranchiibius sp. CTAmp26 TaxID=2815214 RepID=UPI001FB722F9|nr:NAD-dependent epimerase/dehydratase family protein [Allobranchiibius sp. CTAmp26]